MGSLRAKNASEKFSRLGTFKQGLLAKNISHSCPFNVHSWFIIGEPGKLQTWFSFTLPLYTKYFFYSKFVSPNKALYRVSVTRFLLQVFPGIIFPKAPENNIRVISLFSENSWRYSQVNVHHRCHLQWQIGHQYQPHQRYQWQNLPLVSTIPATNFTPVSTTLVANNGNNIRLLPP
jgi:hypothetical protein